MSKSNEVLNLISEYQDKNRDSDIYYSLSTCIKLLTDKSPTDIFILSFEKPLTLPKSVIHQHISIKATSFISFQPLKLDTILISVKTGEVIDLFDARKDIKNKIIRTVRNPFKIIKEKPFLSIRVAAIRAETGFSVHDDLYNAICKYKNKIKYSSKRLIWKEFRRLLRADKPSLGIELLRVSGVLSIILPELDNCFGVDQNKRYHAYTVYKHCLKACDVCATEDVYLRFAALIHDIGKPLTKGTNENGITFHKHEVISTKLAKKIVKRFKIEKNKADYIILLVSNHMYQYNRIWKDSTIKRFIKRTGLTKEYIGKINTFPLFLLRNADRQGRDLNPITKKQLDFEKRLEEFLKSM